MPLPGDPVAAGRLLAALFQGVEPRLWSDLEETGAVPPGLEDSVRPEWECLALDACLRGLVASAGFGELTAGAVDAFHAAVLEVWAREVDELALAARRARLAARYEEYGARARGLESAGTARVSAVLGEAAAAHAFAPEPAPEALARLLAAMHEAVHEGAIAALATGPPDA